MPTNKLTGLAVFCLIPALVTITGCNSGGPGEAPERKSAAPTAGSDAPGNCGAAHDGPAQGRIVGQSFEVEKAKIENGILELRQGEEFFADRSLTIFLFVDSGEVPVGRTFQAEGASFGKPHIHMGWMAEGESIPETEIFMNDYEMSLDFGEESDGQLAGRIHLCLPDEQGSFVSGEFVASIEGFRLVNGKPDYRQDAHQNFEYLAREYLQAQHGDATVEVVDTGYNRMTRPADGISHLTGSAEVSYRLGNADPQRKRFLFVKEPDSWRVHEVLKMDQLIEAHPYQANASDDRMFRYLAASQLEQTLQQRYPGRSLHAGNEFSVIKSYRYRDDVAEVSTSVLVEGDETPREIHYRLSKSADGWKIDSATEGEPH